VNVFVHSSASERHGVFINYFKTMHYTIKNAIETKPIVEEELEKTDDYRYTS
jgi:formaldehyde-activating enzyme involved in methanogenesis